MDNTGVLLNHSMARRGGTGAKWGRNPLGYELIGSANDVLIDHSCNL